MGQTRLSGPFCTGDLQQGETNGPNIGFVELVQTFDIAVDGTLTQSVTRYIPAGSIITSLAVDVLTAYDSATSATLSVGVTAGATTYTSGVNVKAATGRIAQTYTAAQLAKMSGQSVLGVADPTVPAVVATVTSVGQPTVGYVHVTMHYVQLTSSQG